MALYYWICPNCGISVYEDYLECRCGYVATEKDVESSKVKLQDLEKISKEERGKTLSSCKAERARNIRTSKAERRKAEVY